MSDLKRPVKLPSFSGDGAAIISRKNSIPQRKGVPALPDAGPDRIVIDFPPAPGAPRLPLAASIPALAFAAVAVAQTARALNLSLEFSPVALQGLVAESYARTGNLDDTDNLLTALAEGPLGELAASHRGASTLYVTEITDGLLTAEWRPTPQRHP